MNTFTIGVAGGTCTSIPDEQYLPTLVNLIRNVRSRCVTSLFIVDPSSDFTSFLTIFDALKDAVWLGADVRVIIGGSRENFNIAERSASARKIFLDNNIPCRWILAEPDRRGSHVKLVVADDMILIGSHNWSPGAFAGQIQDSVLVQSSALATYFVGFINEQWHRAGEE